MYVLVVRYDMTFEKHHTVEAADCDSWIARIGRTVGVSYIVAVNKLLTSRCNSAG